MGTLTVIDNTGKSGGESNMALLATIAGLAGVALANAQLVSHEHQTAAILQRRLRPASLPPVPGFEIAVRHQAQSRFSGISGDFYDVIPLPDGRHVVTVGDIEGKGIAAAAKVGVVRQTLRATVSLDSEPSTVFRQLNDVLGAEEPRRMCTLAYVTVGHEAEVSVWLAGHPPPVLVTAQGVVEQIGKPCPPLGIAEGLVPIGVGRRLAPGDTLILYTDGYAIGTQAPPETIMPLLADAAGEEPDALLDRLLGYLREAQPTQRDDVVLMALRCHSAGEKPAGT